MHQSNARITAGLRGIALLFLATAFAPALGPAEAQAQEEEFDSRIVHILEEPRHRIVHHDNNVWVLDVQINPGDTTLAHTHDGPIMYTFISSGSGPSGGRVSANTDYVEEEFTHRVNNQGPELFRIIALTNYGAPLNDLQSDRPVGLEDEPQLENEWFRSYRLELAPGEETAEIEHQNSTLVVQVSEGRTHVTREDGITRELDAMGDWAWRDPGSKYRILNAGDVPVSVVVNEARRSSTDEM